MPKKLNGGENYWITEGLKLVEEKALDEIKAVEAKGKNPLMTQGFIIQLMKELKVKVDELTLKSHLKS